MTEKIKDRLIGAFWGALVCFLISYMAGGYHFRDAAKMVVRTDTLHDTVTVREPVFVTETAVRTDTVWLPVVRTRTDTVLLRPDGPKDSALAIVPITQKVYADSTYRAWVSGYSPKLDSIAIYNKTVIHTITRTEVEKCGKFGIGVVGGVGFGMATRKPDVFLGVGFSYRLW
ncbi:DUF6808 domain-containing protein [Segatella buccae]